MQKRLTVAQLATIMGVSKRTVYRWKKRTGFPYLQTGRVLRFDLEKVTRWLQKEMGK